MREIKIDRREAGQRFDKYLKKYLSQAGSGFIYKMLRKKNITLNGSKASGNEILSEGDVVKMFFSEETFEKYTGASEDKNRKVHDGLSINVLEGGDCRTIVCGRYRVGILYEDSDVIFFNKPAGLLSQGDGKGDVSLVDILEAYINKYDSNHKGPSGYRPGICNRLDRNTSGVVAAGKSVRGLQELSEIIKHRNVTKLYVCLVEGKVTEGKHLKGYLTKDADKNKVTLSAYGSENSSYVETIYRPLKSNGRVTMLEVELVTGKTHQIRAHMASEGHPIVGDKKYGSVVKSANGFQMLHANKMVFGKTDGVLKELAGRIIEAAVPEEYNRLLGISNE